MGLWVLLATIFQARLAWFALGAVLWLSALLPRLNPFDALHNLSLARRRGVSLTSAPAPRRFAQGMAATFALAIGIMLTLGWRLAAYVLEGMFLAAIAALMFGGFCLGSFVYHVVCGRADFAKRTLPWASGAQHVERP